MLSHLFIFAFVACAFVVVSKKSLPRLVSKSFSPVFLSDFTVSSLTVKYLIHLKLIFVIGVKIGIQFHSVACKITI